MPARTFLPCSIAVLLLLPSGTMLGHDHGPASSHGLEFHENNGQWPNQVLYRALTAGGAVFIEPDAFTHVVRSGGKPHGSLPDQPFGPVRAHAYRVHFVGGHAKGHAGTERRSHYANYFLGNDQAKWAGGVGVFGGAELNEVYPGIDLHVDGATGLKYDWELQPGADASLIRLRFEGQDALEVRDGMVYISTSAGEVIEQRPVAWSEVHGVRVPVECEYARTGDEVRYVFPQGYDARYPLVIDPTVIFGSYIGSAANSWGFTATYDNDGHLYGGGIVFGFGYPVTLGVLQSSFAGDVMDMNVTKFSPDGTTLIWSTYIGGTSGSETPHSMVVNSANELYLMGVTGSPDFPTTTGSFDSSFGFGPQVIFAINEGYSHLNGADAFISHFSADATQLLGSTFIGGSDADGLNNSFILDYNYGDPFRGEIIMDQQERPIVVTSTISPDMPVSANATQPSPGGQQDGYACMLDPGLTTLLWGTYYGGSLDDSSFGVQQAPDGRIYVTGGTQSPNLPMAGTPYHPTWSGAQDGYIAGFSADGSALMASTYLGTAFYDQTYFVQIDLAGFVYVVGQSHGAYPVSSGVYANPNGSQFIHKLDHDLSVSQWSTRIGTTGSEDIAPSAFLVSDCGQIYFSGWGGATVNNLNQPNNSTTFGLPTTPDALQSTTDGNDFYLMVLNADAASLAYATFYGGTLSPEHVDGGTSRFDKNGIVYQAVCAGCWNNSDFPTTPGAWSNTNNAGVNACNLGVFKIDFEQNVQVTIDASITAMGACITEPIVFNAVGTATEWSWDLGDGTMSNDATLAHLYDEPGTYTIQLIGIANGQGLCVAIDTAYLEVNVVEPLVMDPEFSAVPNGTCAAVSVEFFNTSTGTMSFFWQFGDGGTSSAVNPVHPYAAPGEYEVILAVIDPVCTDTLFAQQTVLVAVPGITVEISGTNLCNDVPAVLSVPGGFDSYAWSTGGQGPSISVDEPGEYGVLVIDGFCSGTDSITVAPPSTNVPLLDYDLCPGTPVVLSPLFFPQQILWSTGLQVPMIVVSTAGTYWYEAIDPNGCVVRDTAEVHYVTLATGETIIPNVFSPNGDKINDIYLPENIDAAEFHMDIYNRWGMKVFSSTDSDKGWNGKLDSDGETVPDGTYFIILSYIPYCSGGDAVTHKGHVTLLR